ncbi:sulfite exporter TauE/SafE family protein [Candidatus Moduliflexota bacterium]
MANGTNRLAIFLQCLVATGKFHQYGVFPVRFALAVSAPAVVGGIAGALLATTMGDEEFKRWLAALMVVMTLVSLYRPGWKPGASPGTLSRPRWAAVFAAFFLAGIYGGFIQAGVGFLLLGCMALTGYDLVAGNAVKVFVVLLFTTAALVVFVAAGKVEFLPGLVLGSGNVAGALAGAKTTVVKGNRFVQAFFTVTILLFAALLILR